MELIHSHNWQNLEAGSAYGSWRAAKLEAMESALGLAPVTFDALESPPPEAVAELARRCRTVNFGQYHIGDSVNDVESTSAALVAFARHFGLIVAEEHRSAGAHGVVALRASSDEAKKGYIPYTTRGMNWHTDGYYNAPEDRISGFALHCLHPAARGGENQIIDPEIAYIRLRDENPAYIRALMAPGAMTIPENREPDGSVRPASVGPVFFPEPDTGRMQMRYTHRTRSIAWADDPLTAEAVAFLRGWLEGGDPLTAEFRLKAGQGLLNNNVLHNRTPFEDGEAARIILRVRFRNRVSEEDHG